MKTIDAKVLDPTHLELEEPLALRPGARVAVAVGEPARETSAKESPGRDSMTRESFRQREQLWRQNHCGELSGYAGQWVVLEGDEIVAHGEEPARLVAKARERGIRSPYVFYVEPRQTGVVKIGL